ILRVESERKTKLAIIEKLRKKLSVDSEAELSTQRDRIADLERELPEELHSITLSTSDITPEALEALMEQNGGRMSITSDEGGISTYWKVDTAQNQTWIPSGRDTLQVG